ncbi:MAG: hypothetical protein IKP54_00530 [Bacteroidales bacterium]|nr:hypothetical protein [Bacteroidales bacterium]
MSEKKKTNIILYTVLGIIGAIVGALILVKDFKSYWDSFGEVPAEDIGYIILFAILGALVFMCFGLKIDQMIDDNRKWEVMYKIEDNW